MRFGKEVNTIAIPEWKECYLDYQILKIFVIIIKEAVQAITYCDQIRKQVASYQDNQISSEMEILVASPLTQLDQIRRLLIEAANEENQLFYKMYICQTEITQLFYQMKVLQMQYEIQFCQRIQSKKIDKKLIPLFLTYIQYVYIQVHYVSEMREVNMIGDKKILKKHKKNAKKLVQTPNSSYSKIDRIVHIESHYMDKIQDLYIQANKGILDSKEARQMLRQTAQKAEVDYMDYFLFGFGVGATIILLATLILIIRIQNLDIESRSDSFARDFPTWRGVALFIFYIWILGFNLYCFQKYKISHRLIFKFEDHHYSTSSQIFKTAGIFTTLFMVVFLIYLLLESKIIRDKPFLRTQYFVLIVWSSLGIYLFMPLKIFNYEGRLYAIKLILKSLVAPIFEPEFTIVWITDQWNSMITPLRDLFYTVCYYQVLDFDNLNSNPCKDNSSFTFVMLPLVIAISYKILQSIRKGIRQGKYFMTQNMGATIKYLFSLVTAFISFVYNQGSQNLLVIWVISSIVSTIFSYYWDLKYDWGLLEPNSKNWMLRKYITFEPKKNYYIIMWANFLMRWSWTITLSPSISGYFGSASLLRLVTGSIQIIRRGIWNLLKVQKEHLKNCNQFKAVPDMKFIEEKLQGKPQKKVKNQEASVINVGTVQEFDNPTPKIRQDRKKQYITLIKKKIEERQNQQKSYTKAYKKQKIHFIKQQKSKIDKIKQRLNECQQIIKQ